MTYLFDDLTDETASRKPRKSQHPIEPPKPDPLADALVQHKLVPNAFLLDLNRSLSVPHDMELPHPWNLPSRLFRFPIEVTDQAADGSRKMGLLHPLSAEHPFVKHVEATLSITIDPDGAPNEYGYTTSKYGSWWHAVDLISAGRWHDLLETAQFTTPDDIAGAVGYGLHYSPHEGKKRNGYISTAEAREIMAAIDAEEPADRQAVVSESFAKPSPMKEEGGKVSWPINTRPSFATDMAWGYIVGIECGWFSHDRGGFLGWTARGRERFPPEERKVETKVELRPEEPTAQTVIADEIAPRHSGKVNQLDLF